MSRSGEGAGHRQGGAGAAEVEAAEAVLGGLSERESAGSNASRD
jgi:hypothetical protein